MSKTQQFNKNNIGDTGVIALALALPQLKKLATLNLKVNNIFDDGAITLGMALESLTSLGSMICRTTISALQDVPILRMRYI